jgi:hypothetical protein
LAIESPPAVVNDPPFVADVASVTFDIPSPPESRTEPVALLVLAVVSLLVILGKVRVELAYVIPLPAEIADVPLPSNTPVDVKVVAPVPPYATAIAVPCHTPAVTLPPMLRSVPTNNFLAVAIPPAVVIVPPFVEDVASVVLLKPNPPLSKTEPVVLDVLVVESLLVILGKVSVDEAYVIPDPAEIALVPLPSNTPVDVNVVAPVPP